MRSKRVSRVPRAGYRVSILVLAEPSVALPIAWMFPNTSFHNGFHACSAHLFHCIAEGFRASVIGFSRSYKSAQTGSAWPGCFAVFE